MLGIGVFVVMVFVAGLAGGIGFMVGRGRAAVAEEQARSWKETADQMRCERDTARQQAREERDSAVAQARGERDTEVARARSERDDALAQVEGVRAVAEEQLAQLRAQHQAADRARTTAQTELAALQQRHTDELATLQQRHAGELERAHSMHTDINEASKDVTAAALQAAGDVMVQRLVEMNEQRAQATAREFDKRENGFDAMVKPAVALLKETTGQMTEQMAEMRKDRATAQAEFAAQVKQVRTDRDLVLKSTSDVLKEVGQLTNVFRKPGARGMWGEQTLRTVIEGAGMSNLIDFEEQPTFSTDAATQRPDLVINITTEMKVVIDAKAPFNALIEASEARDETEMRKRLALHAQHVRKHIEQLHNKKYWQLPEKSPEFVVMFMPSDAFLHAAWEHDRGLWDYAAEKHIILAGPSSLMAILKSAAAVLRYDRQVLNTQEAVDTCKELIARVTKLSEHVANLGTHLGKTVGHFDAVVGCLESRVLPTARKVQKLQGDKTPIPELDTIDRVPRQVTSAPTDIDDSPSAA